MTIDEPVRQRFSSVAGTLKELVPPSLRMARRAMRSWRTGEPELHLLPHLCVRGELALDVGANNGVYAWHMARWSAGVIAFEPQPQHVAFLNRAFGTRIRVEPVALSDFAGEATLRVPVDRMMDGCASIEAENTLADLSCQEYQVTCRPLDSYDLDRVSLIKIDVEGHELTVLKGAMALLARDRPSLIIEAEERHRPDALFSICRVLDDLDYRLFYWRDGALHELPMGREADGSDIKRGVMELGLFNFVFVARPGLAKKLGVAKGAPASPGLA